MLSCNTGNYLIKRQNERHIIIEFITAFVEIKKQLFSDKNISQNALNNFATQFFLLITGNTNLYI